MLVNKLNNFAISSYNQKYFEVSHLSLSEQSSVCIHFQYYLFAANGNEPSSFRAPGLTGVCRTE